MAERTSAQNFAGRRRRRIVRIDSVEPGPKDASGEVMLYSMRSRTRSRR